VRRVPVTPAAPKKAASVKAKATPRRAR
jgi:hypothetical protein